MRFLPPSFAFLLQSTYLSFLLVSNPLFTVCVLSIEGIILKALVTIVSICLEANLSALHICGQEGEGSAFY